MLQSLKDQCSKFLSTNIDIEHACTVFQTAHDFQMKELEEEALNFILKKGRGCLESFDFLHLSAECLKLIVHSDKLVCEEENVFKKMILWAKQRCEDQSILTTDHNIRQSLGELLYLIRFPCMEPKFFTDEVSSKSILTLEEIDEVYEHFNDKQTDIFSTKHRLSKIVRVQRCKVDTSTIWGYYGLDDHCVDFQTSNDGELTSVLLFGSETYSGSSEITINILHGCSVLSTKQTKINSISGQEIYEIWLEPSVNIVAHNRYTIHLNMKGPATFRGQEYVQKVTNGGDFVVTFLRPLLTSGKNTNETRGQIPGLVFQV
ncbi:unnamed protein product [Mytilus coruscus]|uniref:BACK domain-containing protein n=1 Tax=Mytilus coruscus TaxID=42192 RepID=A0A6J8BM19_MYTCO|nr:unnamed protein product [Mytilus coruscus]